jgi:hypothetical protein
MIVRPQSTQLAGRRPADPVLPQKAAAQGTSASRVRLNLRIKRLSVEGLAPSEQGIFVSAFRARLNTLAQNALHPGTELFQKRRSVLRRIDGGVIPPHLDAKSMGERAAAAIFKELLR